MLSKANINLFSVIATILGYSASKLKFIDLVSLDREYSKNVR